MSCLIDGRADEFRGFSRGYFDLKHPAEDQQNEIKNDLPLQNKLGKQTFAISQKWNLYEMDNRDIFRLNKIFLNIFGLIKVQESLIIKKRRVICEFSFKLLTKNDNFLLIQTKQQRILVCKELSRKSIHHIFNGLKIAISSQNGLIRLSMPFLYTTFCYLYFRKKYKLFEQLAYKYIKDLHQFFFFILQLTVNFDLSGSKFSPENPIQNLERLLDNLYKYIQMVTITVTMDCSQTKNQEYQILSNIQQQRKSVANLVARQVTIDESLLKNMQLFLKIQQNKFNLKEMKDFNCNFNERQQMKMIIAMPTIQKSNNPYDNANIMNFIKLNNPERVVLRKFNSGGFADLFIGQFQFWYVCSQTFDELYSCKEGGHFTKQKLHKKLLVLKRGKKINTTIKDRIKHEKQIISKIKNGNAVFLPKFYFSNNIDKFFNEDILVDFISYSTLNDYIFHNGLTISLSTKIHFIYLIIQGLRYLKMYRIVHLDLKPNNIMISRSLMIKLIDFGESYHPDVCKSNHHIPGFTIPYSSPEIYQPKGHFSQKNDVFSIGVIFYQILFDKFPFFAFSDDAKRTCYEKLLFMDRWFFTPEENNKYGDTKIFPILNLLVAKCLHPDPHQRPQLDWLSLIIRSFLEFFH